MYVTFINKKYGQLTKKLINPMLFLMSNGIEGIEYIENKSKEEYITIKIDKINSKYIENYCKYIRPHFETLNNSINRFLSYNPDFLTNKQNYYTEFKIPKKKPDENGRIRYRKLINPRGDLKILQRQIADTLVSIGILPHNAAHAFREGRDYYSNAAKHQKNNHIINLDLKDFFDSIDEDILYNNLMEHLCFNVDELGNELAKNIIKIALYKGTTPQGSPLSPLLSNLIMVKFDYLLRKELNKKEIKTVYTRYADDMTFSSKLSLDITDIIHTVENILKDHYNGKIKINYSKTKKITPGRCFITGVKLNKEHKLTVGWEKKKLTKSRIYNLLNKTDLDNPDEDTLKEIQSVLGYLAFINSVEKGYARYLLQKYNISKLKSTLINNSIQTIDIEDFDIIDDLFDEED